MLKNKRIKCGLLLTFCMAIVLLCGFQSHAENVSGEQTISQEEIIKGNSGYSNEITMMDENGNITVIGDTDGIVESGRMLFFMRSTPVQVVNFNTKKSSETTSYKEYVTGASGYTNGDYGADAAYLGTENGKVKFMLSGVVGLVDEDEVQIVNLSDVKAISYYIVQNERLLHRIVHNMSESGYVSSLDQGPAPSYLTDGVEYYSYDGHYFYKEYAVMLDDYRDETRTNSVNAKNPYYNYYQYLPLRSKVSYTGKELNSLINAKAPSSKMTNLGDKFVEYQNAYGTNALLITGIAANESAWGTSSICKTKNNLFGINAVDTSPSTSAKTFESPAECVRQFAETYMSKRYLRPGYTYYHGAFLGNKASGINVSYASDPYWGEKAANAAWSLDKNGGSKNYGTYTIGIKDTIATAHNNVTVRSAASATSTSFYKTGAWTSYAVLLQNEKAENGFYKIQSDSVLKADRSGADSSSGKYDTASMYAYISADYVTVVNKGENLPSVNLSTPELVSAEYKDGAVTVKWKKVSNAEGYNVYRKLSGGSWSKIGQVKSAATITYKDSSALTKGKKYVYTVRAYYGSTLSGFSSSGVEVTIPADVTYTSAIITSKVNYRDGVGLSAKKIGTLAQGKTIQIENGYSKKADGYTWYRFKMNSKNYYVITSSVKKLDGKVKAPELVSAGHDSGTITVKWKKVSGATGYYVYRKVSGGSWSRIKNITSGSTVTYKDSNITNGKTYVYTVRAYNAASVSECNTKGVSAAVPKKTYVTYVTKSKVNYRTGAGLNKTLSGTLPKGTKISVESGYSKKADGYTWYRFRKDNKDYYIVSIYIKKK